MTRDQVRFDGMLVAAGVILLLISLTALYVAAEFAAVGARRSRLRRMAEDGHPLAARLRPVLEDPRALDRYIAASQVGITLSSLILGAYAQAILAPSAAPLLARVADIKEQTAGQLAAVILLVALTILSVILGELVPKAIALQHPTQTALFTVLPMQWSLHAYAWLIDLLNGSAVLILRLFGMPSTGHRHVHSPEEIALLIAESRDGGLLEPQEQVRLHRALRLGLRNARQLMVPRTRLVALELETPMTDVQRVAATSPYSRLPVYRRTVDDIVGILHTKDVVLHFVDRGPTGSLATLVRPIQFNGHTYSGGAALDIKWSLWQFGYEWDFMRRERGFLGVLGEVKYNDIRATVRSVGRSDWAASKAAVPTVGIIGRQYLHRNLAISGELSGLKVPGDTFDVSFWDFDISATASVSRHFGVEGGYRAVTADYAIDEDSGDLSMRGIYVGLVSRF